jgi:beta-1,4-mannosyl-glycoprotein beta-1,4-N-acetylglucosaminyltransferase
MIYDCIYFFNEIDILQIRLAEIGDYVDKIILVEGSHTYSQNKKISYYTTYKNIFNKYNDKIIHHIVDMTPLLNNNITDRWEYDYYQKNKIIDILKDLKIDDDDLILISDVDEIPYKNKLSEGTNLINDNNILFFHYTEFRFFFNYIEDRREFVGSFLLKYKKLKTVMDTQKEIRNKYCHHRTYDNFIMCNKNKNIDIIKNSGLHLSSFGGPYAVLYKVQSYAHKECDTDSNRIKYCAIYSPEILFNNEEYRKKINFYDWYNLYILYDLTKVEYIKNKDFIYNYTIDSKLFSEIKNNKEKYINLFLFNVPPKNI